MKNATITKVIFLASIGLAIQALGAGVHQDSSLIETGKGVRNNFLAEVSRKQKPPAGCCKICKKGKACGDRLGRIATSLLAALVMSGINGAMKLSRVPFWRATSSDMIHTCGMLTDCDDTNSTLGSKSQIFLHRAMRFELKPALGDCRELFDSAMIQITLFS
jgi:hypothetical protein